MNPFLNDIESAGKYGSAMKQAREKEIYPSPFFDIASSYFPNNIKELFKFIKYIISTNELVNVAIDKLASYPITDLIYYKDRYDTQVFGGSNPDQEPYIGKWRELLENDLNLKSKLKVIGKSYLGYGNAFVSLYVPFIRVLSCNKCKSVKPVKGLKYRYDPSTKKFKGACPDCNTVSNEFKDIPRTTGTDCNIIVWDPSQIELQYHPLSDTSEIFYTISSDETKKILAWEDVEFINKTPLSFIESCYQKKDKGRVKFNSSGVIHMKRHFMPGLFPGWGWPLPAVILKQAFYLQLLRKANETIFEQHILPFIALFPQSTQGLDVYRQVNLGDWKGEVEAQFKQWRQDPAHVGIFPVPIGQQVIGGQGKAFELIQEANNISEAIIVGLGIPKEFIFGGMSWSASSVSIRIIENDMINFREEMLSLPNKFLIPKLAALTKLPPVYVSLQDFKMADDLQQQQLMFQLMANRVISKDTFFKDCGYDTLYSVEQDLINKELDDEIAIQEKLAQSQAKIQGASQLTMMQYQAIAGGLQAGEQRLSEVPPNPPLPPPPPPDQMLMQAHQMLTQMFSPADMAHLLRASSWQIDNLVQQGKIPPEAVEALNIVKNPPPPGQQGMPPEGMMPQQGIPPEGMMPQQGMPQQGMPPEGMVPQPEMEQVPGQAPPLPETVDPRIRMPDFLPDDQVAVLSSIPDKVLNELLRYTETELKGMRSANNLSPVIVDAVITLKRKIKEDDPANPMLSGKAKANKQKGPVLDKATLDSLVTLPTAEIVRLADTGQIHGEIAKDIISRKVSGYLPAQPVGVETPQLDTPPQTPIDQGMLNQLLTLPPEHIQHLAATGQIPPEVAEFVMRHQSVPTTAPVQAPMPVDPMMQQVPAQQMPPGQMPGQMPGELMPSQSQPQGQPQVPPEFMSPSGVPMSAKELIRAGVSPMELLSVGYSPEDLKEAGVPVQGGAAFSENVPADVLKVLTLLDSLTPTEANTLMSQLMQVNPDLHSRVMSKFSRTKAAMNPFDLLKNPPSANNLMGMSSDIESPWSQQSDAVKAVKKLLNDFAAKQVKNTESSNTGAKLKGPSEISPNKNTAG